LKRIARIMRQDRCAIYKHGIRAGTQQIEQEVLRSRRLEVAGGIKNTRAGKIVRQSDNAVTEQEFLCSGLGRRLPFMIKPSIAIATERPGDVPAGQQSGGSGGLIKIDAASAVSSRGCQRQLQIQGASILLLRSRSYSWQNISECFAVSSIVENPAGGNFLNGCRSVAMAKTKRGIQHSAGLGLQFSYFHAHEERGNVVGIVG